MNTSNQRSAGPLAQQRALPPGRSGRWEVQGQRQPAAAGAMRISAGTNKDVELVVVAVGVLDRCGVLAIPQSRSPLYTFAPREQPAASRRAFSPDGEPAPRRIVTPDADSAGKGAAAVGALRFGRGSAFVRVATPVSKSAGLVPSRCHTRARRARKGDAPTILRSQHARGPRVIARRNTNRECPLRRSRALALVGPCGGAPGGTRTGAGKHTTHAAATASAHCAGLRPRAIRSPHGVPGPDNRVWPSPTRTAPPKPPTRTYATKPAGAGGCRHDPKHPSNNHEGTPPGAV